VVDETSAVPVPAGASPGQVKPGAGARAEDRAASLASAGAILAVRGVRYAAGATCRTTQQLRDLTRRFTPILRKRAVEAFLRIRAAVCARKTVAWVVAAGIVTVLGLALFVGRPDSNQERQGDRKSFADRLRDLVGATSPRVSVLVQHGLESGTLEVWADRASVLRRTLSAPKKQVSGLPFLSYRTGKEEWTIRLAPGEHDLVVVVAGKDGNQLTGKVRARVEPKAAYRLEITVRKWPWSKLGLEWAQLAQGGAT
jgi:hypothetical protein